MTVSIPETASVSSCVELGAIRRPRSAADAMQGGHACTCGVGVARAIVRHLFQLVWLAPVRFSMTNSGALATTTAVCDTFDMSC